MGKINSRAKGAAGEREIANILKGYGYDTRRGQQFSGLQGDADVVGLPYAHLEIKRVEKLNLDKAMEQSKRDARDGEMPIVMHRKNRAEWLVTMPLTDWMKLYQAYEGANLLKCAIAIRNFFADKNCSATQYWDEDGNEIMHTDIGYFDEGLDELIEYLQGKEKQNNGEETNTKAD